MSPLSRNEPRAVVGKFILAVTLCITHRFVIYSRYIPQFLINFILVNDLIDDMNLLERLRFAPLAPGLDVFLTEFPLDIRHG